MVKGIDTRARLDDIFLLKRPFYHERSVCPQAADWLSPCRNSLRSERLPSILPEAVCQHCCLQCLLHTLGQTLSICG